MRHSSLFILTLAAFTLAVVLWPTHDTFVGTRTVRFAVWGMPFEDRLFEDVYARGWERLHPEITVDYGRFNDVKTKYNAWASRGTGAEVMRMEITWYPDFIQRGMLEPLNTYIHDPARGLSPEQLAKLPPHLMALLSQSGEVYALPEDNAQFGLFYNTDLFDQHNRDHPEDRVEYPTAAWTWHDLRRAAKSLTRRDSAGRTTHAGFDTAIWSWPFLTLLAQAGGQPWSDDGRDCLVNSPAGVKALDFLRALQREDRSFNPTLTGYKEGAGADTLFAAGHTAMLLDGSWRVPNLDLNAPQLRYAVAPLPRGEHAAVVSGCVLWAISAHSKNKDQAWEMIKWLLSDEQASAYWDTLRVAPPANLAVVSSSSFASARGVPRDRADPAKGFDAPPMPPDQFDAKAAWLRYGNTPDPATARPPAFVHMHLYAADLQDEITRTLNEYLRPESTLTSQEALDRVVITINTLTARNSPPSPPSR